MKLKALLGIALLLIPSLAAQKIPRRKTLVRVVDQEGKPVPGLRVQLCSSAIPGIRGEDLVVGKTGPKGSLEVSLEEGRSYTAWGLLEKDRGEALAETKVLEDVVAGSPILLRMDRDHPVRFHLRVSMLQHWKAFGPLQVVAKSRTKNPFSFPLRLTSSGSCRLPVIPGKIPRIEFYDREGRPIAFWEMSARGRTKMERNLHFFSKNPKIRERLALKIVMGKPGLRELLVQDEKGKPLEGVQVFLWNNLRREWRFFGSLGSLGSYGSVGAPDWSEPPSVDRLSSLCFMGKTDAKGRISLVVPESRTHRKGGWDEGDAMSSFLPLPLVFKGGQATMTLFPAWADPPKSRFHPILKKGAPPLLRFCLKRGETLRGKLLWKGQALREGLEVSLRNSPGPGRGMEGDGELLPLVQNWLGKGGVFSFEGLREGDRFLRTGDAGPGRGRWAVFETWGGESPLQLSLAKLPLFRFHLRGPGGEPAGGTRVFLTKESEGETSPSQLLLLTGRSDQGGTWNLRLRPGSYRYFLFHPSKGWAVGRLKLPASGAHRIERSLSPFRLHSGVCLDSRGRPFNPFSFSVTFSWDKSSEDPFLRRVLAEVYPGSDQNLAQEKGRFAFRWIPLQGVAAHLHIRILVSLFTPGEWDFPLTNKEVRMKKFIYSPFDK